MTWSTTQQKAWLTMLKHAHWGYSYCVTTQGSQCFGFPHGAWLFDLDGFGFQKWHISWSNEI